MNKIDHIYYINLARCPERNDSFLTECKIQGIPFNKIIRFEAVDGLIYEFKPEMINMFKNSEMFESLRTYRKIGLDEHNYKIAEETTRKIMGNQLSHYLILDNIINNGYEYAIICQDDSKFNDNFVNYINKLLENIPEDAELINIGLNEVREASVSRHWDFEKELEIRESEAKEFINDFLCKLDKNTNPASLAYIVTLQGAKNIINHFLEIGFLKETDFNYNNYLITKDIFYSSRKILVTSGDFNSDIFSRRDKVISFSLSNVTDVKTI
jgi:hypothetical protein